MNKSFKKYRDTVHGFDALASSQLQAWMLIRNKCHELKLQVPMIHEVEEVQG